MNMFSMAYNDFGSGVVHIQFFKNGQRIASGTGFVLQKKLVTNNHVYDSPGADEVLIRTVKHNQTDTKDGIRLAYQDFKDRIDSGSPEEQFDYAILDIPELEPLGLYRFDIERKTPLSIGREYAILGYPLDHHVLTVHSGLISARYEKLGVDILQLDASVNNGNSGGPLVELTDGGVVGIVTRKATGLTSSFKNLYTVFDNSIELIQRTALNPLGVRMRFGGGYDPNETILQNFQHLKSLCREIERSANTGIAYAFSIEHLAQQSGSLCV